MSTRSIVGVQLADGTIRSTYVHCDGFPSAREPLLHMYFNTFEDALQLVSNGWITSIGEGIDDCEFNDDNIYNDISENLEEFLNLYHGDDYKYLFAKGEWYWCTTQRDKGKILNDFMEILPNRYKQISIFD